MPISSAVIDACVLFNAPVRDTLLRAAEWGLYSVYWSRQILHETANNLIKSGKTNQSQAEYLVSALTTTFPEAIVIVPKAQVLKMTNSPKDRHVAACAVRAHAQIIITFNVSDFKQEALSPWNIEARHPDQQLLDLYTLAPDTMLTILNQQAEDLKGISFDQLLEILKRSVPKFVNTVQKRLSQQQ